MFFFLGFEGSAGRLNLKDKKFSWCLQASAAHKGV